jgi:hypothetical protein
MTQSIQTVATRGLRTSNLIAAVLAGSTFNFFSFFLCVVDWQFPLDLNVVQRDHQFLDDDSLHALFRLLTILNRTAKLRGDSRTRPQVFDFAANFIFPSGVRWRPSVMKIRLIRAVSRRV